VDDWFSECEKVTSISTDRRGCQELFSLTESRWAGVTIEDFRLYMQCVIDSILLRNEGYDAMVMVL